MSSTTVGRGRVGRAVGWSVERARALLLGLRQRRGRRLAIGLALGLLALLAVARFRGGTEALAVAEVREGPFRVTIVEAGTVQALRSVTYASSIQSNQAKIVTLAPEGRLVQKGDLLILFDGSPFEEEIRKSQAQLAQAEADVEKARHEIGLQEIQNREDLANAHQKVGRSELELRDVQEGRGKLKEEEAVVAVASAEREVNKAEGGLNDLKPLLDEGFITKLELERAEQQLSKAREDLELARKRRDSFLGFGRPLELSQAQTDATSAKESAKQLVSAAGLRLEQRRAEMAGAQSRIQEAGSKLALAKQQLARTEVRADVPGIVVYRDVFFGAEQRKPQVGDPVWANQPLLILPDISKMVVDVKIRETDIHKVEKNQKVVIRVDAYPDVRLTGKVSLVGTLAQEERERRGGVKFFAVSILVDQSEPRLRPGMTARVEIRAEERSRALYVPLDAVFERDGRSVCYIVSRWGTHAQEVVLGPSNADFVVIEKGVRAGDRVALREPGAAPSDFGAVSPP